MGDIYGMTERFSVFAVQNVERFFKRKRNPRKTKWTKAYRLVHKKELAETSALCIEKKINRPEKYNRETMVMAVEAVQKIEAVRRANRDRFFETRFHKSIVNKRIPEGSNSVEGKNPVS